MGPVSPLPQLIDPAVQGNPLVQAMQKYLQQRNAIPLYKEASLGDGSDGGFQGGVMAKSPGQLTIRPGASADVYPHELSHAVMRQMARQYHEQTAETPIWQSPENPQFVDIYKKLFADGGLMAGATSVDPKWVQAHSDYRTSPTEAPAWAVGNVIGRQIDPKSYVERSPSHIDANMVTQLSMLLDAAMRQQPGK